MSVSEDVGAALERLVTAHDALGSPLRSYLRPGRDAGELAEMFEALGIPLPSALVGMWSSYDAIDQEAWQREGRGALWLLTTSVWLSAQDAASQREWLVVNRARINPHADPDDVWPESFVPVFALNGSFVAVDASTPACPVWVVHFEEVSGDPTRQLSRSMSGFLSGTAAQFASGEYVWNQQDEQLQSADGLGVDLFEEANSR